MTAPLAKVIHLYPEKQGESPKLPPAQYNLFTGEPEPVPEGFKVLMDESLSSEKKIRRRG